MKTAVIMPAYEPDGKMTAFVDDLIANGYDDIIIVNDGSGRDFDRFFEEADSHPEVTLITYEVNKGKGGALKTAFKYLAENRPELAGAITVDSDGQHTVECIKACMDMFGEHPDSVVLGGRDFSKENVPKRSYIGNTISRTVYRFAIGIRLNDTQTGLRIIPAKYFELFSTLKGDRYEYETNMLIAIVNNSIPYHEVPIETIYIDDNASSHFNTLKDSVRIYKVVLAYFLKFMLSSLSSWLVDIGVYALTLSICVSAWHLKENIAESASLAAALIKGAWNLNIAAVLIATVTSRVISSIVNFLLNRKIVFKAADNAARTAVRYFTLAVCQLILSFLLVDLLANGVFHVTGFLNIVIKCVVDALLFILSYTVQRKWVFKNKKTSQENT